MSKNDPCDVPEPSFSPRTGWGLAIACLLTACAPAPTQETTLPAQRAAPAAAAAAAATPATALRPVPFTELPALLDDGDRASLRRAIGHSRGWLARRPAGERFVFGPRQATAGELVAGLDRLLGWLAAEPTPETFAAQVAQGFEVLESVGGEGGGMLLTGYYEPLIDGSTRRSSAYPVPVYGPPADLIRINLGEFSERLAGRRIAGRLDGRRLVPYPDRREIRTAGPLRGREIAWARDPVDLFFVEIQGSGALRLPDGRELRIGYAGGNGREYRSIGKLLLDEGKIERSKISMQAIRAYLAQHPEEVERVLDHNLSVVFFRQLSGPPVGNLGVPVTPGRTIATDQRLFPPAALGFLVTELAALAPDGRVIAEGTLARFVLNQDTGGAIRGAGRADFFWGRGEEAASRAGAMQHPGRLFFLVPKR